MTNEQSDDEQQLLAPKAQAGPAATTRTAWNGGGWVDGYGMDGWIGRNG